MTGLYVFLVHFRWWLWIYESFLNPVSVSHWHGRANYDVINTIPMIQCANKQNTTVLKQPTEWSNAFLPICVCVYKCAPIAVIYFMLCQISPSPILLREDMGHTLLTYSCVCVGWFKMPGRSSFNALLVFMLPWLVARTRRMWVERHTHSSKPSRRYPVSPPFQNTLPLTPNLAGICVILIFIHKRLQM